MRKLRLKGRIDDTAEGVELHPEADLEGQRGCVACSMEIRIPEGIIVGAGRGDDDEEGEKPEDFWGAVGSIRERYESIFLVGQQTGTCGKQEIPKSKGHNITGSTAPAAPCHMQLYGLLVHHMQRSSQRHVDA